MQTYYESYKFLVIPLRLYNPSATFIFIINGIFYDELDECVVIYVDDILVYSNKEVVYARDLRQILNKLRQHDLLVNEEKKILLRKIKIFSSYIE